MQNELSFLITLQNHDAVIDELQEKADAVTPRIQAKNQQIEKLKSNFKTAKEALTTHQVKKKQLELDADAKEKLVQKHQSELNSLKSNDAYKAMLSEIQTAKDDVKKIEDDILALMEAVERDEKKFKELDKKLKFDEAVIKNEIQQLESQKNGFLDEIKKKQEERMTYAKTIPSPLLTQYDVIRQKGGGLAIVPMMNNTCGGCRMSLTQAKANDVRKAKAMILCDSCSRILYMPVEQLVPPTPTPETAPAPAAPV